MHLISSTLVCALIPLVLVACDPSSESSLEVENSTSYELLVTTESSEGLATTSVPIGETVEVKHILDIGPPRPPSWLRGLSADIVRLDQRATVYAQRPIRLAHLGAAQLAATLRRQRVRRLRAGPRRRGTSPAVGRREVTKRSDAAGIVSSPGGT
jgi:hypothetical protein